MAKVAHMRLCHSRMPFLRAYPREAQEMVFDAHEKAFAFFKGACQRGIYDNMKTAVDCVFVGKDRQFNRRFLQLMSHHLVEPTACTPAAGWEKGQVENQVGTMRERFFTPRLKFKSYDELNAWLLDRCVVYARTQPHPEQRECTVFDLFEAERASLVSYRGPFDGFHATTVAVSKTCLVRFDGNKYSVLSKTVGRPVGPSTPLEFPLDGSTVSHHAIITLAILLSHAVEASRAYWRGPSCGCRKHRCSIGSALCQDRPRDASHLVGQRDGDLLGRHLRK
jgi:hypothetical protein